MDGNLAHVQAEVDHENQNHNNDYQDHQALKINVLREDSLIKAKNAVRPNTLCVSFLICQSSVEIVFRATAELVAAVAEAALLAILVAHCERCQM